MYCRPILFIALCLAIPAAAQTPQPQPPEAKPAAVEVIDDSSQPQVTIRQNDQGEIVEERRVNGKLYQITVMPENAPPYVLIDPSGDGNFIPLDTQGSPRLGVPMWVIGTF
ncbi:MAG: DUF2782 domain-containing protein [Candidatus Accumulibacter sp.]|jgi:hypothetical protein|nr:DUF2782 domain-containing protein [Accumulibacter sp.]